MTYTTDESAIYASPEEMSASHDDLVVRPPALPQRRYSFSDISTLLQADQRRPVMAADGSVKDSSMARESLSTRQAPRIERKAKSFIRLDSNADNVYERFVLIISS